MTRPAQTEENSGEARLPESRYERAAGFVSPAGLLSIGGLLTDGYWIDDRRFFYTVTAGGDAGPASLQPMLADLGSGVIRSVLDVRVLKDVLSRCSDLEAASIDLGRARFDMPDADTLVVTLKGVAYHIDVDGPKLIKAERLEATPALYSPDGRFAAFLKDYSVWARDRATGVTERLTGVGEALFAFGYPLESGIAPVSGRRGPAPSGLWSPNSRWFATHRVDERRLPATGIVQNAPEGGSRPVVHTFVSTDPDEYPPLVEFSLVEVESGRSLVAQVNRVIPQVMSPFAMRQCWFAGEAFYFVAFDRFSCEVSLVELSLSTGAERVVLTERAQEGWLDLHPTFGGEPLVRVLAASNEVIWVSDRAGRAHLYLHDLRTGELKASITHGDWVVREIVHVDEANRKVLFLASGFEGDEDAAYRSLCTADLNGGGFRRLVVRNGDLVVAPDPVFAPAQDKPFRPSYAPVGASSDGSSVFAWLFRVDAPTQAILIDLATGRELVLATADVGAHWNAPRPRPFVAIASDGVTTLHGAMYLPSDFSEDQSYPVVDFIYPGPQQSPYVRRFPSGTSVLLQSVAELGMVGVVIESRGAPGRTRAFHQAGRGHLTEPQLSDHVAVLKQLCDRHSFLEPDRIGIFGQSGGGYATARALFDYPDVFKAGVSVCGNHDSRNYIAYWLNKYGGRPGTPERDEQANTALAGKLQGDLFLIHGDMDENVHVGHTLALSAALIAAGKPFDQLIVPNAGHGVLMESAYVVQRLWDYFARHLLGAAPPADFVLRYRREDMMAALHLLRPKFN